MSSSPHSKSLYTYTRVLPNMQEYMNNYVDAINPGFKGYFASNRPIEYFPS